MKNYSEILMPINQKFIEVFQVFMDENQKAKIRANNVRQYTEGIIDLLLKNTIIKHLKGNENYLELSWKKKLKIIEEFYDKEIATKFREIFRVGGEGSHFNGSVNNEELDSIVLLSIHIVEDIFVKYFLNEKHYFGTENIYTIFSMLPLYSRIYILENVYDKYKNQEIVDRLSLAYVKNGDDDKAVEIIYKAREDNIIDDEFKEIQLYKLNILKRNLTKLYEINSDYLDHPIYSKAIIDENLFVVGLPTAKNVFDTAKSVEIFRDWFKEGGKEYPEFINLFLCLMATDTREYI